MFNRAVNKQTIFRDTRDYARFLFLILYLQSDVKYPQIGRIVKEFVKSSAFDTGDEDYIVKNRSVELVAFCIMPNHFHLILKEVKEGGISEYLQRVLTAYSKYHNLKYEKSGHVFQGPYRFVHIDNDRYLKYLSAYIHRNPIEILGWRHRELEYPWSSFQDFVNENRWGKLLVPNIVSDEYSGGKSYLRFVNTSPAKIREVVDYLEDFA